MSEGAGEANNFTEGAGTKRSSEGGNWQGGKKMRGDSVTLRFLLHSKHAGGIIGKGGETIKRLRSEFSATVTVPDTNTNERVLSIGADKDNVLKVLRECLPLMHEAPYPVNTGGQGKESQFEIDFLVHSSQVGGIIGRAGFKIKQLREETSANIKVYQECLPDSTERVVAIGGEEDQVVAALQQMLDVMQEQPIKGNITLYDPSYDHGQSGFEDNYYNNNFNGPPGPQRGGMGGGMRGNRMGGPRGGPRGGMGGGMGGPGGRGPPGNFGPPQGGFGASQGGNLMGGQQEFGNNFGNNYSNDFNQGPPQGEAGFGGGAGGGNFGNGGANFGGGAGGGGGGGQGGNAPPTTTQVTIPNDMAGAIIGKGGERIRGIRQKCGADIKFSDSDPGKKDRLITISGSQDQIQYAQYLMQQCVRQHHSGSN